MSRAYQVAAILITALVSAGATRADLTAARAEPKLERRARKALQNAEKLMGAAQESYKSGDWSKTKAELDEVRESVELAYTSLKETGKDPRRKPKHFKRAEIKTRNLLRKLVDFRQTMSVEERDQLQSIQDYIQKVHDELLEGILGTGEWEAK